MTGLTNTPSEGALAPQRPLSDLEAIADSQIASAALELEPGPWRDEVAARLARYRARRKPRAPRYPSLLLPFDSDIWPKPAPSTPPSPATATQSDSNLALAGPEHLPTAAYLQSTSANLAAQQPALPSPLEPAPFPAAEPTPKTKIIEFPRSAAIPTLHASSLADPIFDRPRIVEAPEVVPPPPALGGILIEPSPAQPAERRPAESGTRSASIPRRLLATAVDGLVLIVSLSAFGAIFLRFNPLRGPLPLLAGVAATLAISFWFTYQYLLIVYTGSTPGLRAARLTIAKSDGSPVTRRLRRWRVLASLLSGLSAGLGYLWCFLDSDSLCWHDRITRTLLRPGK